MILLRKTVVVAGGVALAAMFVTAGPAAAQSFTTGQVVYATPSGASNDWYSGCVVGAGRSNSSYQVECAGSTWWIGREHIRTTPPAPGPDPMRPGQTLTPVVTPSHPPATAAAPRAAPARTAAAQPAAKTTSQYMTGNYADNMHRMIEQDKVDAKSAVLKVGKYTCYAGGRYTFSDLYITGPHSYRVEPGGSGSYSYNAGALTFSSGPYAGAYSRMVDGHTVGVSAKGNTNLGTQCGFEK